MMDRFKRSILQILLLSSMMMMIHCVDGRSNNFDDYNEESNGDDDNDHLYSTINCNIGDKYDYVMATQSRLFNDNDNEYIQIKTRIELKCLMKTNWLNETDNQLKNGQIFEANIRQMQPIRIKNSPTNNNNNKNGQLQMASLFATLKNLNEITNATDSSGGGGGDNDRKQPNLKVGAVNGFFTDLAKRFGDWFIELMQKFFHYLQTIMSNKNRRKSGSVPVNFYQCSQNKNNESKITTRKPESSRIRRNTEQSSSSSMPIDLEQFASDYSEMYRHPFQFVQLMDGSIQNIKLSELDQDPNIIQFKKFIIRSFGTQLDERKKRIIEIDELGTHYCHYQMEFDEPDVNKKPVHYLNQRSKRHSYEDDHIVSIMRQFKSDDIIVKRHNNRLPKSRSFDNNDNLKSESVMNFMDFNVQEIQLVRNNMVVASGGYFQGFMPILTPTTTTTKNDDRSKRSTNFDKHHLIDKYLRKHLDLNMQYSMVRLNSTNNSKQRKQRNRRSIIESDPSSMETPPPAATIINYVDRIVKHFENLEQQQQRTKRETNNDKESTQNSTLNNNVVCQQRSSSTSTNLKWQQRQKEMNEAYDNEIDTGKVLIDKNHNDDNGDDDEKLLECYEYKSFGTNFINANFNRSIITRLSNSKRDNNDQTTKIEEFETRYKIAASLFGIDLIDGQINLSKKSNNDSWLILNLFGSTYENLNLCEIRNKDYSQSGIIPLFVEDIWFKTNIAIKIHYKLNLKLDIPFLNCNNQPKNNEIIKRVINDELELKQNAMMEFAVVAEANFLIVNAKMRLNGKFDMDSMVDFTGTCLSAKTFVKPMNIVSDIQYEFYHPICGEWMMDHWKPKPLSWKLNKDYHRSWSTPNNTCV